MALSILSSTKAGWPGIYSMEGALKRMKRLSSGHCLWLSPSEQKSRCEGSMGSRLTNPTATITDTVPHNLAQQPSRSDRSGRAYLYPWPLWGFCLMHHGACVLCRHRVWRPHSCHWLNGMYACLSSSLRL